MKPRLVLGDRAGLLLPVPQVFLSVVLSIRSCLMLHEHEQRADVTYLGFVLTRTIESTYMYYR